MHFVTFLKFSLANFWRAACICSFSVSVTFSLEAGEFTTKFVKFAYGLGLRCICSCGTSVCVACVCLGCVYLLFVVKAIKMRSSITRKFEWTSCRRDFVRVIYRRAIFLMALLYFYGRVSFLRLLTTSQVRECVCGRRNAFSQRFALITLFKMS